MDERKQKYPEPWDDAMYGTGNTQPPKSYGGLIAVLLMVVILLSGIVSVLGILNIQLFNELEALNQTVDSVPMSFSDIPAASEPPAVTEMTDPRSAVHAEDGVSIHLRPSPESIENIPQEGGCSWQENYEKNIPAVVSISVEGLYGSSTGTGVIISELGYIVTNEHVVADAYNITVLLTDERSFAAHVVGTDPVSDLAVLHIEATGLTAAEFGDSTAMRVGDAVAAIGDPLGVELRGSMTDGIISAINRDVQVGGRTMTLLQTNAALNAGNSGGPLVNCYGQVIGINTMKISAFAENSGVEGLGFAIPSATVKEIVDQLVTVGYVAGRPTLGLEGESLTRFEQAYYRWPAGLYLTQVEESSDAALHGIQAGDILVSINGSPVTTQDGLENAVYALDVGETVQVVIYRGGSHYQVELTVEEAKG